MDSPFIIFVLLLMTLTGFVIIQIKARFFWRLMSLALILTFSCWVSYFFGRVKGTVMLKEYERGVHEIVGIVDQLATEGRTNDAHQVCQQFQGFYLMRASDFTNFDRVIEDAESRVSKQPFTTLKK